MDIKRKSFGILIMAILMFVMLNSGNNINSVKAAGVQNAIFPMQYLHVYNTNHSDNDIRKAVDFSGKDTGIDNVFAPFNGTIVDIKKQSMELWKYCYFAEQ